MPTITISDLVSGSNATGAVIPADQAGSTVKVTPGQIVAAGVSAIDAEDVGALPELATITDITASQALDAVPSGTILRVTSGTVTLEVNPGTPGTQITVVWDGATAVDFDKDGSVTWVFDTTTFDPALAADGSAVTVVWLTATRVMLAGDLALA